MIRQLTEETFEQILLFLKEPSNAIDLRHISFIDPYGMVGLLEIGEFLKAKGIEKCIHLPESEEVTRYLERMDFFNYAKRYFRIKTANVKTPKKYSRSSFSDVLLEITPIERSDDIHLIVNKVKVRANRILKKHLHYGEQAVGSFVVALSEVCQNIIEHSENKGFVGIQKYFLQSLDKNFVKIAVMDLGIGFKNSLKARFDIGDDVVAIERALVHGASRHADTGRGHGLAAVRRFVNRWNGRLSIRSGTARFSIIPEWSRGKGKVCNLAAFPGAQISIVLPET